MRSPLVRLILWCVLLTPAFGEDWTQSFQAMPLRPGIHLLHRTNLAGVVLEAFRSNRVVKALAFLPGATDELYMFKRATTRLETASPTLFDAIQSITNQTRIRATMRGSALLLHTDEDLLEPDIQWSEPGLQAKMTSRKAKGLSAFNDCDWPAVRPVLAKVTQLNVQPSGVSRRSWHFYRHSMAWCDANALEVLELTALAGKTRITFKGNRALFECDERQRKVAPVASFPKD